MQRTIAIFYVIAACLFSFASGAFLVKGMHADADAECAARIEACSAAVVIDRTSHVEPAPCLR